MAVRTSVVTVTTDPTLLGTPSLNGALRVRLDISAGLAAADIFVGGSNVTTSNGRALSSTTNEVMSIDTTAPSLKQAAQPYYATVASGTESVQLTEVFA